MCDTDHNPARSWLCLAVWSMVIGIVLLGSGKYLINRSVRKIAAMQETPRPSDIAKEIARTSPIVDLLYYLGVPLVAGGVLLGLPAAVLCLIPREK